MDCRGNKPCYLEDRWMKALSFVLSSIPSFFFFFALRKPFLSLIGFIDYILEKLNKGR